VNAHDKISTPAGFAEFASEWFEIAVPPVLAVIYSGEARDHQERWETSTGPFCWVKNRLLEAGYFDVGRNSPAGGGITAILHIGFLSLPESQEMLQRLKNERPEDSSPARSRFSKAVKKYAVAPIDATAGRVSPGDAR